MRRIWNGHVIRELEGAEPTLFAVHHCGAETVASKFPRVLVDPLGPLQELFLVGKQESVVVEVVQIDFEAPLPQPRGCATPRLFTALGNELKRRLDGV